MSNIGAGVRQHLTWKGQRLVNVDIKNSQPFISTCLFRDANPIFPYFSVDSSSILSSILQSSSFPPSYILQIQNTEKDVQEYIEKCVSGELYKFLEEKAEELFSIKFENRKEVKKVVFTVLFSDNRFRNEHKQMFRDLFPTVYKIFAAIKRKRKNNLAVLLQALESDVMLNHVCKRIASERHDVPMLPIHDSITTTVGNEEYIARIIEEEVMKYIGHTPSLSFEYYQEVGLKLKENQRAKNDFISRMKELYG